MSDDRKATDQVQGEGDYEAAEEYSKDVRGFVKRGKVQKAARDAEPDSPREQRELEEAEEEGRAHARDTDSGKGR